MLLSRSLYGALISALVLTKPIQAAEWSAEPRIQVRSGYNDNIRLTTQDHDSVWETALTPAVKFGVKKEHQGVFGDASASIRRFSGGSGSESSSVLDREDYFIKTNAYHKTERGEISALLHYTRDSTLDSELDETGQAIEDRATRTRITLAPNWSRMLNETTRLIVGYNFTTVDYTDDPGISDLVNYDYDVLSASLIHSFSPKLQGTVSSFYSRYQPDSSLDAETTSLQLGITRKISETLTTSWLAGMRNTTSDTQILAGYCVNADPGATFPACTNGTAIVTGTTESEKDDNGSIFRANITKLVETGKISASLSRSSNPSGNGDLLDTTRLLLYGEHKFTENLRTSLSVEYSNAETIVNTSGRLNDTDEDLFRVKPKLLWRWRREWQLTAEYEYTENDNNNSNTDIATRKAFYLTLSYHPPKISASR